MVATVEVLLKSAECLCLSLNKGPKGLKTILEQHFALWHCFIAHMHIFRTLLHSASSQSCIQRKTAFLPAMLTAATSECKPLKIVGDKAGPFPELL